MTDDRNCLNCDDVLDASNAEDWALSCRECTRAYFNHTDGGHALGRRKRRENNRKPAR